MARDYYDDDQRRYQGRQIADDRSGLVQNRNDGFGGRPSAPGQGRGYERQQSSDNRQAYGGEQFRGHYGDETGQGSAYVGERNYGDGQANAGRGDSGDFRNQQRYQGQGQGQGQGSFGGDRPPQQGGRDSGGYGRNQHQNFAVPGEQQGWGGGYPGAQNGGSQGGQHSGHRDPDYHQWREEQLRNLDRDYESWRKERYQQFSNDFNTWRSNRGSSAEQQDSPQQQKAGGAVHATPGASDAGGAVGSSATSGKAK